jgi:hypothetical protein
LYSITIIWTRGTAPLSPRLHFREVFCRPPRLSISVRLTSPPAPSLLPASLLLAPSQRRLNSVQMYILLPVFLALPSVMLSPALHPLDQTTTLLHGRLLCLQLPLPRFVLHLACPSPQIYFLHRCVVKDTSLIASVTLPSSISRTK